MRSSAANAMEMSATKILSQSTLRSYPTNSNAVSETAMRDSINSLGSNSLLRGVTYSRLMKGFGSLLRMPSPGSQYSMSDEEAEDLHNTSSCVRWLDWFISHSWRDPRWWKYLCVSWVVNRGVAFVWANVFAAVWAGAAALGTPVLTLHKFSDEGHLFGMIFPIYLMVYVIVLLLCPPSAMRDPMFFLDKCCIHQTDPVRKSAGITHLGGFLKHSRRMLVIWGPDYFERLWCSFEIACYMSLHGVNNIDFVPVYTPMMFIIASQTYSLYSTTAWLRTYIPSAGSTAAVQIMKFSFWFISLSLYARALRLRADLHQRLSNYKLRDSHCYCCSVNHLLPQTGRAIPCDREFVEGRIREWFDELRAPEDSSAIHAFERRVRELPRQLPQYDDIPLSTWIHGYIGVFWAAIEVLILSPNCVHRLEWALHVSVCIAGDFVLRYCLVAVIQRTYMFLHTKDLFLVKLLKQSPCLAEVVFSILSSFIFIFTLDLPV